MDNLFEAILRESNYDKDVEKFNSIKPEQIGEKFDCTILSGPHNDKTGPCYCVDDHDHHITILYMQDILEAFKYESAVAAIISSNIFKNNWDLSSDREDVFDYVTSDGKYHLVVVVGKGAEGFLEEVVEVQDSDEFNYKTDKCYVIAATEAVEQEVNKFYYAYDMKDIVFNNLDELINKDQVTISSNIKNNNTFVLSGIESNSFRRV